jgi:rhodanese-related sulfurtransferase
MKFAIIFLTIFTLSCVSIKNPTPKIQNKSAKEAKKIIAGKGHQRILIVDGRSEEMYDQGHIPGAINIEARVENTTEKLSAVLNYRNIFVYCLTNTRSLEMAASLKDLGYKGKIFTLIGGINAWREAGFEIATN